MKRLLTLLLLVVLVATSVSASNDYTPYTHPNPASLIFGISDNTLMLRAPSGDDVYGVLSVTPTKITLHAPFTKKNQQHEITVTFDASSKNRYVQKGIAKKKLDCTNGKCKVKYRLFYNAARKRVYLKPRLGENHPRYEFDVIDYGSSPGATSETPIEAQQQGVVCSNKNGDLTTCDDPYLGFDTLVNELAFKIKETPSDSSSGPCVTDVSLKNGVQAGDFFLHVNTPPNECKPSFYLWTKRGRTQSYEITSVRKLSTVVGESGYMVYLKSAYTDQTIQIPIIPSPIWFELVTKLAAQDPDPIILTPKENKYLMVNPPSPFTKIALIPKGDVCADSTATLELCIDKKMQTYYTNFEDCTPTKITAKLSDGSVTFTDELSSHSFTKDLSLKDGNPATADEINAYLYPFQGIFLPLLISENSWNSEKCRKNFDPNGDGIVNKDDVTFASSIVNQDDAGVVSPTAPPSPTQPGAAQVPQKLTGWQATITQTQNPCVAGEVCTLTFKLSKTATAPDSPLPSACIIGVLEKGFTINVKIKNGEDYVSGTSRWVISCKKLLEGGVTKTLQFPTQDYALPKMVLFPANLNGKYATDLTSELGNKDKLALFNSVGINNGNLIWSPGTDNIFTIGGSVKPLKIQSETQKPSPELSESVTIEKNTLAGEGGVLKQLDKGAFKVVRQKVDDPRVPNSGRKITLDFVQSGEKIVAIVRETGSFKSITLGKYGPEKNFHYGFENTGGQVYILQKPVEKVELISEPDEAGLKKLRFKDEKIVATYPGSKPRSTFTGFTLFGEIEDKKPIPFCAAGEFKDFSFTLPIEENLHQFSLIGGQPQKIAFCTDEALREFLPEKYGKKDTYTPVQLKGTLDNPEALTMPPTVGATVLNVQSDKAYDFISTGPKDKKKIFQLLMPQSETSMGNNNQEKIKNVEEEVGFGTRSYLSIDPSDIAFSRSYKTAYFPDGPQSTGTYNDLLVTRQNNQWEVRASYGFSKSKWEDFRWHVAVGTTAGAVGGFALGASSAFLASVPFAAAGAGFGAVGGAISGGIHVAWRAITEGSEKETMNSNTLFISLDDQSPPPSYKSTKNYIVVDATSKAEVDKVSGSVIASTGFVTGSSPSAYPGLSLTCPWPSDGSVNTTCYSVGECYGWLNGACRHAYDGAAIQAVFDNRPRLPRWDVASTPLWHQVTAAVDAGRIDNSGLAIRTESSKPTLPPQTVSEAKARNDDAKVANAQSFFTYIQGNVIAVRLITPALLVVNMGALSNHFPDLPAADLYFRQLHDNLYGFDPTSIAADSHLQPITDALEGEWRLEDTRKGWKKKIPVLVWEKMYGEVPFVVRRVTR